MFSKDDYILALKLMLQLSPEQVTDLRRLKLVTLASIYDGQQANLVAYNEQTAKVNTLQAELAATIKPAKATVTKKG
jgi:hypothetical protein